MSSTDIWPHKEASYEESRAFLTQVTDILMDHIKKSNDRSAKVLDFHQPNELWKEFDFTIPDQPTTLGQILLDCKNCLKYQVKTGEWRNARDRDATPRRWQLPSTAVMSSLPRPFDKLTGKKLNGMERAALLRGALQISLAKGSLGPKPRAELGCAN